MFGGLFPVARGQRKLAEVDQRPSLYLRVWFQFQRFGEQPLRRFRA
jgi:hypothetical protein